MFIISNLEGIGSGWGFTEVLTESATSAGLVIHERRAVPATEGLDEAMPELEVIRRSISGPTGRRSAGQILARLSSRMKRACSRSDFVTALDNVSQLVSLSGPAYQVVEDAEAILKSNGASLNSVRSLGATLLELGDEGVDESAIHLDLSFVRGVTYYTGIVFEFLDGSGRSEYAIGGGGRYDDLVRAFGGDSVPACGFALYVDEVVRAIRQELGVTS